MLIKIGQMGPSLLLTAPAGSSDTIGDSHRNREDKIHHETSNNNLLPTTLVIYNEIVKL